ncbi:hypothetical protein [Dactylosporangium matsuzakiense]|uniref:Uncharacterized protein n=1 Tax=Dactylosporangium matsuzakiense TaxID=53360 RepID=A0A9W6KHM4_9ACTN|nr:hypothetical protein [Dactylosporangium matsuzakiense]UWZ41143.1 hypothetical protein Dmats_25910 [Dactylosporangium matsuzakiense]GLL00945.1 hypothetical protein GCM10017581_026860 [Dactylosporangium matsuzakiense]
MTPIIGPGTADAAVEGVYVLASSAWTKKSRYRAGEPHTVFTGVLLDILRHGSPEHPGPLPMATLFELAGAEMRRIGASPPQALGSNSAGSMPLVRNSSAPSAAPAAATAWVAGEMRAYVRHELSKTVREELAQLWAGVEREAMRGYLSDAARKALWRAVADLPPLTPTELGACWKWAVARLDPPPPGDRFTDYSALLRST